MGKKSKVAQVTTKNTERLIIFVSGVVASAVVSSLIEQIITWSEAALIGTIIVVLLGVLYHFSEGSKRLQSLADRMEILVHYVEESYRVQEGIQYKGLIFEEMNKLVSMAQSEILVLAATNSKGSITRDHNSRADYLEAIEKNILKRQNDEFRYVRIHQVYDDDNLSLAQYLGEATSKHGRRILELERALSIVNPRISLNIMKVPTQRLTEYIIVDRRYIGLEIDGITSDHQPYAVGMFIIEDRGGKLVEGFVRYFENLQRLAQPISLEELFINEAPKNKTAR